MSCSFYRFFHLLQSSLNIVSLFDVLLSFLKPFLPLCLIFLVLYYLVSLGSFDASADDESSSDDNIISATNISEVEYAFISGYGLLIFFLIGNLFTVF